MLKYILMMFTVWFCGCIHEGRTESTRACTTPQYARLGQVGIIRCSFSAAVNAIYWYDTRNSEHIPPIIRREETSTTIDESKHGEFDIFLNGSLKISQVSMHHDKYFRVLYFTENLGTTIEDIQLVVTVQPAIGFPVIDKCIGKRICFAEVSIDGTVSCYVNDSKPAVNLMWFQRNTNSDTKLQSDETISEKLSLYTSEVELNNIYSNENLLQLLVCKSDDILSLLTEKESVVLLENIDGNISPEHSMKRNVEVGYQVILPCHSDNNVESLIWKRVTLTGNSTVLAKVIDNYFTLDNSVNHLGDSLVIPVAEVQHSGVYMCVYNTGMHEYMVFYELYVYVTPTHPYPLIDECTEGQFCRTYLDVGSTLLCSVERSRPPLKLSWIIREGKHNRTLQSHRHHSVDDFYYRSFANTTVPSSKHYAMILACVSENDEYLLVPDESAILIENTKKEFNNNTGVVVQWVEINTQLRLTCSEGKRDYLIWKRKTSTTNLFESLLYTLYKKKGKTHDRCETTDGNTLLLSHVTLDDEGIYVCIHGNGESESVISYRVNVYVNPTPEYLVVDGCENQQYCVLTKGSTGNVTCSVFGIRPDVHLEWRTVRETSKAKITFYDREVTRSQHEDTFNVVLKSSFRLGIANVEKLTIECRTTEPEEYRFSLSTTLDLVFTDNISSSGGVLKTLGIIAIIIVVLVAGTLGFLFIKRRQQNQNHHDQHEMQPLAPLNETDVSLQHSPKPQTPPDSPDGAAVSFSYEDLLHKMIKELTYKYEGLCGQIHPIPSFGGKLQYEVGKIFIDRTITVSDNGRYSEKFSSLASYNDIFKQHHKRIIIEGDPGYGKSTMMLQAAKGWYTRDSKSSLKDVDIFILLQLKMLHGIPSIYKAIKTTLLPTDTSLSESHIEYILHHKSVVIVLDDFDEYPDKHIESDFINILKGDMLQDCRVVLLTRISCLPDKYHATTQFMQLNGFNNTNQNQYIKKTFNDSEGFSLKELTHGLPMGGVFDDMLKVPLFFTMLVHINKNIEKHLKENITSVTNLFKYFMAMLEGRLVQKVDDESIVIDPSESVLLGKAALNGLSEQNEGKIWKKDSLANEIGNSSYEKFTKVGILVEENSESGKSNSTVKFFHNIFCQWYAAHCLANSLQNVSTRKRREKLLYKLNPFDCQYLYRFTCGLNEQAADIVIRYLESRGNGDEFALLCTLEKTGKVSDIKEKIQNLCRETVSFYHRDSRLLRKSTTLLLHIASNEKIPIKCILLDRCYALVPEYLDHLGMNSGMVIPPLVSLKELTIYGTGRRLTVEETKNIFLYVSKCGNLRKLSLQKTFQPYKDKDDWVALKEKASHNETKTALTIEWSPFKGEKYILDMNSKRWKSPNGHFLTEEDHDKQSTRFGSKDDSESTTN